MKLKCRGKQVPDGFLHALIHKRKIFVLMFIDFHSIFRYEDGMPEDDDALFDQIMQEQVCAT